MVNTVRINQGRILPWQFRLAGTVLVFMLIIGAFLELQEIPAITTAILVSFLLPLIWSTYYVLEIDPQKKTVSVITWIVGLKKGEVYPFESIEKIFINKVLIGQDISSYSGHVHHAQSVEYTAFIKLDTGKKFELLSMKKPEKLKEKLKPIAAKLSCKVIENYEN